MLVIIAILTSTSLFASNDYGRMMQSLGVFFHNTGLNIQSNLDCTELKEEISHLESLADNKKLFPLYYELSLREYQKGGKYEQWIMKALQAGVHIKYFEENSIIRDTLQKLLHELELNQVKKSYIKYIIAKSLYFETNIRGSYSYVLEAYELIDGNSRIEDSLSIIYSSLAFSNLYYLQNIAEAKRILHEALAKYVLHFENTNTYILAALHNNIGLVEKKLGNLDVALQHYQKSFKIKKLLGIENIEKLTISANNIASLYCTNGDFEKALEITAQSEFNFPNDGDYEIRNTIYLLKSRIFRGLGDYAKAYQYAQLALDNTNEHAPNNHFEKVSIYLIIAFVYDAMEDYEKCVSAYGKAMWADELSGSYKYELIVSNLATLYAKMDDYELARKYFELTIQFKKTRKTDKQRRGLVNTFLLYGEFLGENNHFEEAETYLREALTISLTENGPLHYFTGWCYEFLGDLYKEKDLKQSLRLFDDAIDVLAENVEPTDHNILPPIDELSSFQTIELFRIINKKSVALELQLDKDRNVDNLRDAQEHFSYLVGLIEKSRSLKLSNASKLEFSEDYQQIFDKALKYSLELYRMTGNIAFAEDAFNVAERSKAGLLYEQIRENEARQFADIPDSLLQEEEDLRKEIASIQNLIYEEHKENNPDSLKLSNWNARLLHLQSRENQLTLNFEKYYPDYYQFKYENRIYGLQEIRKKLKPGEAMLEYYLSGQWLVSFCITKEGIQIIDQDLEKPIDEFLDGLPNRQDISAIVSNPAQVFRNYTHSAYTLYAILMQPFENEIRGKKLIIIPDGKLGYISFESLLTASANTSNVDYSSLAYVIRDHSISYGYSAALLIKAMERPSGNPSGDLLAFAPAVFDPSQSMTGNAMRYVTRSGNLMNLPQTLNEVTSIGRILRGKVLMEEDATESMFKQLAQGYRILHIATHGLVDDDEPMYSKLAFYHSEGDEEDGFLNTYELFNMKLNAELAVLSACNTGYGKHVKGEGLMTLARGFMYSGVPSLVISLWKVEDRSTATIMELFYANLKEGMSKDEALRKAKLDYLNSAKSLAASPYFWSSFVNIGDTHPIELKPYNPAYIAIGPAVIIFLLSLVYLRRKIRIPGILL